MVMISSGAAAVDSKEVDRWGEVKAERSVGETGKEDEGEAVMVKGCCRCCCSRRAESCRWSLSVMLSDSASSWRSSSPFSERN